MRVLNVIFSFIILSGPAWSSEIRDEIEKDALMYSHKKMQFRLDPFVSYEGSTEEHGLGFGLSTVGLSGPHISIDPAVYYSDDEIKGLLQMKLYYRDDNKGFYFVSSLQGQNESAEAAFGLGGLFDTKMQNQIFFDCHYLVESESALFKLGLTL